MTSATLGLDISKKTFHASLLKTLDSKPLLRQFDNTPDGFAQLLAWLHEHGFTVGAVCLEATSTYGHPVARYLHEQGYRVSIVNPLRIKGFGQAQLVRTKTDPSDATMIARYAMIHQPPAWRPPTAAQATLQRCGRCWQVCAQQIQEEQNRLETEDCDIAIDVIKRHIAYLKQEQKALLQKMEQLIRQTAQLKTDFKVVQSIPGIGRQTAILLLAELGDMRVFASARQLAAFVGLTPQEHTSGTSVQGKARMCKIGSSRVRYLLYMPTLAAIRFNPLIRELRDRLLAAGKPKMLAVGAAMHKLIRLIYGVIRSGQPFDPAWPNVASEG